MQFLRQERDEPVERAQALAQLQTMLAPSSSKAGQADAPTVREPDPAAAGSADVDAG